MKKNLLVTLADKNYILQAKQLFSSVYFNAGWKGDYMLLSHNIPEKDLEWFKNKGILIKRCKPLFEKEFWYSSLPQGVLSPVVSIKFYLFTSEFKEWDNIIFLDADIIVKASLDKLTKITSFTAVADVDGHKLKDQFINTDDKLFNDLSHSYDLESPSFNAGVLAFSTEIIKPDTSLKLKELFEKYAAISSYSEQSILNLFFYRKWIKLPFIYNVYLNYLIFTFKLKPTMINGAILHFVGHSNLPWYPTNYFYHEWLSNLFEADKINLNKPQVAKKLSRVKFFKYYLYLKMKYLVILIDKYVGLVGLFLKSCTPLIYITLKKIKNNLLFLYQSLLYWITGEVPYPTSIFIDPVNICNLKCPLCPTGANQLNYEKKMMTIETYKIVVDKMPFLKRISLFNWGEPFLNKDIFEMTMYSKEKNIQTIIDTNFSLKKEDDFFINILKSGLDELIISLDGASQESYSKYRIGGNFDLVINNIKRLILIKKQFKSSKLKITWKFIVNKFNEHEIEKAKEKAKEIGVDFILAKIGLSDDLVGLNNDENFEQRKKYWLPRHYKNQKHVRISYIGKNTNTIYSNICYFLFGSLFVNPDGKIFPCCVTTDKKDIFGDLLSDSFENIWYNNKYLYARSLFSKRKYKGPKIEIPCPGCRMFKKQSCQNVFYSVSSWRY